MSYLCNIYDRDQQSIPRLTMAFVLADSVRNKIVVFQYHSDMEENSAEVIKYKYTRWN